ncbi:MAG: enolase C-terminal domain-like protein [Candidatus Latescibacterota bacterium]|nr:enolase C-terminal domain-like protein [Candidatus Latescibacterota bacterium]
MAILIKNIRVIPLTIPFREDLAPHLVRSGLLSFANRVSLYRVELEDGSVGYGDAMGAPTDISGFIGSDAVAGLRQIRHGGVQMACYDAVGRALDVPAHALMGRQVRKRVSLGYWTAEVPPHLLAEHARAARDRGYRVYKTKCRPWWDPIVQAQAAADAVGDEIQLWLDFNGHLRNAESALPVLEALSRIGCVAGFESPIPQRDADGYERLQGEIELPIAAHYGSGCCHVLSIPNWDTGVPALEQIQRGLCDAFVLGGAELEVVRRRSEVAATAALPFWIQTLGTSLRVAWLAHVACTCEQAVLSNLAGHTIWDRQLCALSPVVDGEFVVPEGSGLGVDIDEEAVNALRSDAGLSEPRKITSVVFASGARIHFSNEQQRHEAFYLGEAEGFQPGIRLETTVDDGSPEFEQKFLACQSSPVREGTS